MEKHIEQFILQANSKALATFGSNGLNVVPISSIKIVDEQLWLINYFMDKTLKNILENQDVSLVCWSGMFGYQIKGQAAYVEEGEKFDQAKEWIKEFRRNFTKRLEENAEKDVVYQLSVQFFDLCRMMNQGSV